MEVSSRHKRSKSDSDPYKRRIKEDCNNSLEANRRLKLDIEQLKGCVEAKKKRSPGTEVQNSLKQEILQLEKRLQDQLVVRCALEKALGYGSSSHDAMDQNSMPKPARELIKEIAVLELEVAYLEQYLLSLYRKAFDQQLPLLSPSIVDERLRSPLVNQKKLFQGVSGINTTIKQENSVVQSSRVLFPQDSPANPWKECNRIGGAEKLLDSCIHRSQSSLSQRPAGSPRTSPSETLTKAVRPCHSQPLPMLEHAQSATSNVISLAEHLGTRISDHVPETPNTLSEEMIKCMSAIYFKLADPPVMHHGLSSSPISSSSSFSAFSPQYPCDTWSPQCRKDSSFDARLDNPFHVEGLKEFSGPYSTMVEIPWICRESQKLHKTEHMLQNFRLLVSRLEEVDPRKMKHEEKLAFWINIHNALVMHAFLAYGIPQNNLKRTSLLLKAAYNIGGHTISADTIQSSILGCRTPRPGQWLRFLFYSRTKFKPGDDRQAYAIEHPEPLLHFALCLGSHSDPAIRMYTPKRVIQELEAAKEEYVRATLGVRKDHRILLPKIVESFAKDSGLCPAGVVEMIQQCMPESLRKSIKRCLRVKSHKSIKWAAHNFAFRYLISKELVK